MKAATIVLILLTFAAIATFLFGGDQEPAKAGVTQQPVVSATSVPMASSGEPLPTVEEMLGRLKQRLEREPNDAKGWDLLGRSYEYLGRKEDAEAAFARATALGYVRPAAANDASSRVVRGVVTLDPSLAGKVAKTDTVFIFARAVSGPRMPIAVLRKTASDLPIEFELNDSMAMSPEIRLSGFNEVIVGARISASGQASASAGDLEGYSGVIRVGGENAAAVTIDQSVIVPAAVSATGG